MKYKEFNPVPGCGCVLRTFHKLLNKDIEVIKKDLEEIAKNKGYENINEIEVFEDYFKINHYEKENKETPVRDLTLENGKYAVFCFKEDDYHMFAIIDEVVYDKNQRYLDMDVISIYEFVEK